MQDAQPDATRLARASRDVLLVRRDGLLRQLDPRSARRVARTSTKMRRVKTPARYVHLDAHMDKNTQVAMGVVLGGVKYALQVALKW